MPSHGRTLPSVPAFDAASCAAAKQAHANWRERLRAAIPTRGAGLDPAIVGADDRCDLGRMLLQLDGSHPTVQELRAEHARFHLQAARILELARDGRQAAATRALEGEYEFLSATLVGLLDRLAAN